VFPRTSFFFGIVSRLVSEMAGKSGPFSVKVHFALVHSGSHF
jgi:hypothetical protein